MNDYIFKILKTLIKKAKGRIVLAAILSLFISILNLSLPKILNQIIDNVMNKNREIILLKYSMIYLFISILSPFLRIFLESIYVNIKKEVNIFYKTNILKKLSLLSGDYFSNIKSGDLYSIFDNDVYRTESIGIDFIFDIFSQLLTIIFAFILLVMINPFMTIIVVILEGILIIVQRYYSVKISDKTIAQ